MTAARTATLISLALLIGNNARAADGDLDRLMSLLAQRHEGQVSFVEQHFLAALDRPVESAGELLYRAPDRLEKRTLTPRPSSFVLDHGILTIQYGHRQRVLPLADYPQIAPFIDSVRATLAGDRPALERFFTLTFSGSLDRWSLTLLPRDAQLAQTIERIDLQGIRDNLSSVQIVQANGDRSVMRLKDDPAP